MPGSHVEGRDWVRERIAKTTAPVIVDVGPGEGTYSELARAIRSDATWVGVEIFERYVEQFALRDKYDEIVVRDICEYEFPSEPYVLLAGDVLEHLLYDDAVAVLRRAQAGASEIMVSVPIIHYPQGEHEGNPYEAHLYHWGFEEMAELLPGCEVWRGEVVGRFWWKR